MKVILTAGGTGGHIYPALSVAEALSNRGGVEIRYVGTAEGLEAKIVPAAGVAFETIASKPLSRKLSLSIFNTFSAFRTGCVQARTILDDFKPDVVVGFGGYVTTPLMYAAARAGVKTLIHEQNAMPGRANRLLSRWVTAIALNFEEASRYFPASKLSVVGLPIRSSFKAMDPLESRRLLGLDPEKPALLIYGGSRGARSLNNAILEAAPELCRQGIQILHQTGAINIDAVQEKAKSLNLPDYHPVAYIENSAAAFAAVDLVVSRSGASTIAELTVCGLPAILVPYPFAIADHQTYNAKALVDRGAALLIPDSQLSSDCLVSEVLPLIQNKDRLDQMASASRAQAHPDAAERLADLIFALSK